MRYAIALFLDCADEFLNLNNLLIQIRCQVTAKWYQFGIAVGINKETLDAYSTLPPEQSIVEMLDSWLTNNETTATWRDVAKALNEIGLHKLAETILNMYTTGEAPTTVPTICSMI